MCVQCDETRRSLWTIVLLFPLGCFPSSHMFLAAPARGAVGGTCAFAWGQLGCRRPARVRPRGRGRTAWRLRPRGFHRSRGGCLPRRVVGGSSAWPRYCHECLETPRASPSDPTSVSPSGPAPAEAWLWPLAGLPAPPPSGRVSAPVRLLPNRSAAFASCIALSPVPFSPPPMTY